MRYEHVKYFDHVYARVKAVPINSKTQFEIVDILMEDVAQDLMAIVDVTTNPNGNYRVAFRYKKDTVDQVLDPEVGDYLVIRKDGTKVAMSPDVFKATYFEVDVIDGIPLEPPTIIDPDPIDPDFSRPEQPETDDVGTRPIVGQAQAGKAILGNIQRRR